MERFRVFIFALKFYIYNSFITNFPSYNIRHFYLKKILKVKIGKDTAIHMGCFFAGKYIEFGANCVINRNCYFDGRIGKIIVSNNVSISPECYILTMSHDVNSVQFEAFSKDVFIDNYVWIGVRSTILPNVKIGKGAVVGAMSLVTKSLEEFSINVGIPTKKIGMRNSELNYTLKYFPYFNTDIN